MRKRRLVIITEIIAPYRLPVFNILAQHPAVELHVIFLAETDTSTRAWAIYKDEIRFSYQVIWSFRRRILGRNILLNWGMRSALRQSDPQAIICGGYNTLAYWSALFWAKQNKVPFVLWTESNARDKRRNYRPVEKLKRSFMGSCQAFVVPGSASAQYLRQYARSDQTIFTAPNAVDNDFFARNSEAVRRQAAEYRSRLALPERYFLFVGRLIPAKGIFDLLDAYGKLSHRTKAQVGLVLVGSGPARARAESRAQEISPAMIKFPGFVQREALPAYYALAEAFVFPTHSDTWGLVVNEAMACGLAIICSDVAGCATDLVQSQKNGKTIPAADPESLAEAMISVAESQADGRRRMGQLSRDIIAGYSPEACASGLAGAAIEMWNASHG